VHAGVKGAHLEVAEVALSSAPGGARHGRVIH
jgi:hypothetical protein